jgi:cytochrome P450 family 6
MGRFSTDTIASSAFGINSNSFKDPDAEFVKYLRSVFDFSVRKGFANLLQFFAPSLQSLFKIKFVDAATDNFITKTVWSTVEYRQEQHIVDIFLCLAQQTLSNFYFFIYTATEEPEP